MAPGPPLSRRPATSFHIRSHTLEAIHPFPRTACGGKASYLMENNPFQTREPWVNNNSLLRTPQREAYAELARFAGNPDSKDREVGIVLPVGCGKSGCITMAPFAFRATRTLVVAPGVKIAQQLQDDFDPARPDMFYIKCDVLNGQPYPEPAEIRGETTNQADLEEADVVLTNIQQLQGDENRWLQSLPDDFFDLILFDEGHHNVAQSWDTLKAKFAQARIVNFSATPLRADGQLMAGRVALFLPGVSCHSGRLRQAPQGRCPQPPNAPLCPPRGRTGDRGQP